jgi:hypothetical protein
MSLRASKRHSAEHADEGGGEVSGAENDEPNHPKKDNRQNPIYAITLHEVENLKKQVKTKFGQQIAAYSKTRDGPHLPLLPAYLFRYSDILHLVPLSGKKALATSSPTPAVGIGARHCDVRG